MLPKMGWARFGLLVSAAVLLVGCGGNGDGASYDRESMGACLRDGGADVEESEDFIAEQAKDGGLDVEFENGDTATFYFEGTEGQAKAIVPTTKAFAEELYPGAEVEQHGNLVMAYWQETADESKDVADGCL